MTKYNFSTEKLLRGVHHGNWRDPEAGYSKEVSDEALRNMPGIATKNCTPNAVVIPWNVVNRTRTIDTGDLGSGLVNQNTDLLGYQDRGLWPRGLGRLGTNVLYGLKNDYLNVTFSDHIDTEEQTDEDDDISEDTSKLESVNTGDDRKTIAALTNISALLNLQVPNIENIIGNHIRNVIDANVETSILDDIVTDIRTDAQDNFQVVGENGGNFGENIARLLLAAFSRRADNLDRDNVKWLMHPWVFATLGAQITRNQGFDNFTHTLFGFDIVTSGRLPRKQKGTHHTRDLTPVILGAWRELYILYYGDGIVLDYNYDSYNFQSGRIGLIARAVVSYSALRQRSFALCDDARHGISGTDL